MNGRQVVLAALLIAIVGGGLIAVPWFLWLGPHAVSARLPNGAEPVNSISDYRYDGKTFEHWQTCWQKELKSERHIEAIKAMCAFGTHGLSKDAAATVLEIAQACGRDDNDLRCEAVKALTEINGDPAKVAKYLTEALTRELDTGALVKDSRFANLSLKCLSKMGPAAKEAAPVIKRISMVKDNGGTGSEFVEQLRLFANDALAKIDSPGMTSASSKAEAPRKIESTPSFGPIVPTAAQVPSTDWQPALQGPRNVGMPPTEAKIPNHWDPKDPPTIPPLPPMKGPDRGDVKQTPIIPSLPPSPRKNPETWDPNENPVIPPLPQSQPKPPIGIESRESSNIPPLPPTFRAPPPIESREPLGLPPVPMPPNTPPSYSDPRGSQSPLSMPLPPNTPSFSDPRGSQSPLSMPPPPLPFAPGRDGSVFPVPPN